MAENIHKRYRLDLKIDIAKYFDEMAHDAGCSTATVLKLILSAAAKNKMNIRPEQVGEKSP
jgi:DNA-binding CsgD family transcriptional regulator